MEQPPIVISIVFGASCVFCGYRVYKHVKKFNALKLGRSGERAVGQYLENFRESGSHIYHDILGDSFNVDHVVISPKGIFVVETKTYSSLGFSDNYYKGLASIIHLTYHSDIIYI